MFVQVVVLFACGWITNGQYEDVNNISIRATKIVSNTEFITQERFHFAVFPSLKFTCETGYIVRLWFIGRQYEQSPLRPQIPSFRLFSSLRQSFSNGLQLILNGDPEIRVVDRRSERRILASVMPMRFNFTMGDFIGIMDPREGNDRPSMLYHNNSGPSIYLQEGMNSPFLGSSMPLKSYDYPLLAVETEPVNCTSGFLSLDILKSLLSRNIMAYQEPGLYIIPQVSLSDTCSSQSHERVDGIIAGELISDTDASQFLIITWWQRIGRETYNLTVTATITELKPISGHVYSFTLNINDDRLNVTADNVLGIGIDPQIFNLYYNARRTGIMNHRVLAGFEFSDFRGIPITANVSTDVNTVIRGAPLLSFGDRDSLFSDNCIERLPRAEDIKSLYLNILLVQSLIYTPMDTAAAGLRFSTTDGNGFVYLFNSNPFNTSGSVTSWVFAARKAKITTSMNRASQFPQLQIWRPRSMSVGGATSYDLHFTTMIKSRPQILPGALNMYTLLEVDPPANYEQNDIIGIYQPSNANAALQIAFVNSDNTLLQALVQPTTFASTEKFTNEERTSSTITVLPLMTLATKIAVEPSQTGSSTTSVSVTSRIIDSTTPSTNANPSTSSSRLENGAIIGIAVGVLGPIALVMFIVILLLALYIAKKKNNHKKFIVQNNLPLSPIANDQALGNPTYTGGVGSANHTGEPIPTTAGEEYEVPVVTLNQAGIQGANTSVYQDTSQSYETLGMTTSRNNEQWDMEKHIYHVLETSTENQQGQTDEVEIYVPAGDHRQVLSSLTPADQQSINMYATLTKSQFSMVRSNGSYFVESEAFWKPAVDQEQLYHQLCANKYREIPRHNIKITDKLGSGEFGEVNKGVWTKIRGSSVEVAVKTLRSNAAEGDRVSFLQEAAIMGQFRHPNIVTLMGVVTIGNPVMIVLELLVHGDLRSYLKQQKPVQPGKVSSGKLLNFCQHVAAGMDYLHKKGFIHRDLAARNILVAANNTCKISDFGLSRDLEEENYYVSKGGMIPVKWTAPEALNFKKFSPPCDVWSYGIVMYEIWSLGSKPYKNIKNMEVLPKVEGGYRLPPPPGCPREIYRIMIQCWHPEGSCRPTFSEVLDSLLQPESELLYWKSPITEDSGEGVHHSTESDKSAILGASLEAGEQLYPELQSTYMSVYEAAHVPLQY